MKNKSVYENVLLIIIFSFLLLFFLFILIFSNLRIILFNFAQTHAPRTIKPEETESLKKMISILPIAGSIICGFFLLLLIRQDTIFSFIQNKYILISYIGISTISLLIRITGFQFISVDYNAYVLPWLEHLSQNGHFFGIISIKSDYLPFYLYLLSIISFLPDYLWLSSVKIVSCVFDFLLAIIVGKIVFILSNSRSRKLAAYSFILLCPTVFFNSGVWAQCESIYATFTFLTLYFILEKKLSLALFFYGIAITIKLQVIFILPFIIFLYFKQYFSLSKILYIFIGILFTVLIGLPFGSHIQILRAYFKQLTGYSDQLTMNAPSFYSLFNIQNDVNLFNRTGILFLFSILLVMLLFLIHTKQNLNDENSKIMHITLFFFSTLIVPFFLPKMHERYFYLAEIASILYIVIIPKRWYISLLIILPSCAAYFNFLFSNDTSLLPLGLIMMFAVIFVVKWTINIIIQNKSNSFLRT